MDDKGAKPFFAEPLFSIVMPVYNRAGLLPRAVRSVIGQTFSDWELLIVNDGSTDDTGAVAAALCLEDDRIRLLGHPHCGLARTRNLGIRNARGEYITFLDSDDEYAPEHLQSRFDCIMDNSEVELLHGGVTIDGEEFVVDKFDHTKKISLRDCVIGGTFVIRRGLLEALGGFPLVEYGDDAAFFARAQSAGAAIATIDAPTYIYHRGESDSMCAILEREGTAALKEFQNI